MLKEVILFSNGDSKKLSTWSNIPFFLSREFENRGISVKRVDISDDSLFCLLFYKLMFPILNRFFENHCYYYEMTLCYKWLVDRKIRKALSLYPNANLCVFVGGYRFYNKWNNIPSLLIGDWTFKIYIKERLCREPFFFEKRLIRQEQKVINNSTFVIPLFPECTKTILSDSPNANIHYLGNNVINCLYNGDIDQHEIMNKKTKRKYLLFIGGMKYISSLKLTIEAMGRMKNKVKLLVIGLTEKDTQMKSPNVSYYGYLHKDIPEQCELYYKIIKKASVIVNVTPLWAGYSSMIEAMYFYTPCLVSPYKDFVSEFGEDIEFGLYNNVFTADEVAGNLDMILSSSNYINMCCCAHERVKSYTWSSFVDRMMDLVG